MTIKAPFKLIAPYDLTTDGGINRPAAKNVYDSAGTLVTVPADQVAISFDPVDQYAAPWVVVEAAATNLIKSSEDLTDAISWGMVNAVPTANTGRAPDGNTTMDSLLGVAGQTSYAVQTFNVTAATDYGVSVFVRAGTSNSSWVRVFNSGQSQEVGGVILNWTNGVPAIGMLTGTWSKAPVIDTIGSGVYRVRGVVNSGALTSASLLLYPSTNNTADTSQFWGMHVQAGEVGTYWPTNPTFVSRSTTGSYADSTGTLQTAPVNIARTTYDPANLSAPPRLMVENPATNTVTYSEQLNNAAQWGTYQATVSLNAGTAPNGTNTANRLVNGGAGEQSLKCSQTYVSGQSYTQSIFAKAGEVSSFTAAVSTSVVGVSTQAAFNLSTGTWTTTPNLSAGMQKYPNGWWRCWWSFAAATSFAGFGGYWIDLGMASSDPTKGLYLWGAQVETGRTMSSYIATAGAIVTRAADVVSYIQTRAADVASTAGAFVYSNLAENDYPAWSSATPYVTGNRVMRGHHNYEALQNSTNADPATNTAGDTPKWLDLGATNQRACLDQIVGASSSGADRLFFVFRPGKFSSALALLNVDANDVRVSVVDENGVVRYQQTQYLRIKKRTFTDYFFKPVERKTSAIFEKLPFYSKGLITVTVTKVGSTASVGEIVIGRTYQVGSLQWAPEIRGLRFSKISTDPDFGLVKFLKRPGAKEITCDLMVDNDVVEEANRVIDTYTTEPVVFFADVGTNKFGGLLTALGFVSDYRTVLKSPAGSLINTKIQGFV